MSVTFGYVDSSAGARICYATEPGHGVPLLTLTQSTFPGASVISRYEGGLAMPRGLAAGAPWYQFDLRGTGKSRGSAVRVTFDQLVDDAEAVADRIGQACDLVAVNDGCAVALGFAIRRPESVRRMLLAVPDAGSPLPEEEWQTYLATGDRLMGLMVFLMWVHPGADPAECRAMAEESIAGQPPEVIVDLRRAAVGVDVAELATHVVAPTLLINTPEGMPAALTLAACMPFARAADWTHFGDGTINGAAWRRAWDEHIPPGEKTPGDTSASELSLREIEVLRLIAAGKTNRQIAAELVLADGTVSRHVHNILTKLGLPNRSAASTWAAAHGVSPGAIGVDRQNGTHVAR